MKRSVVSAAVVLLVVGLFAGVVEAQDELCVDIVVSPSTLELQSDSVWVTVHADIPCRVVVNGSVTLNGISAVYIKADACGNLVAKFWADDVKENVSNVAPGLAPMVLTGDSIWGRFSGTDEIRVIDKGGKYGNTYGK